MSIFATVSLPCPRCQTPVHFHSVHSVNADRRPDLREAILKGEFQRETCPACGAGFRLDAAFVYTDLGRGQWIAAQPVTGLDDWTERERQARALFDSSYGPGAPPLVQEIGRRLTPRIVFGWSALREKLIAAAAGLDDHVLELLKTAVMRNLPSAPFSAATSPRLMDFEPGGGRLLVGWVRNADDAVGDLHWVARELYDEIAADADQGDDAVWADLRAQFDGALFVDVDRLLVHARGVAA